METKTNGEGKLIYVDFTPYKDIDEMLKYEFINNFEGMENMLKGLDVSDKTKVKLFGELGHCIESVKCAIKNHIAKEYEEVKHDN